MRRASFRAYGLGVQTTFDLPIDAAGLLDGAPTLSMRLARPGELARAWSQASGTPAWQTMFPDDCHVRFERGRDGDHLLTFGRRASFHLDRECERLLCAPASPRQLEWRRFLLETALCCASSIRGFEALHASAVSTPDGVAAFVAARGDGKSTLAAELLGRGHALVCDDVLALGHEDERVLAHPGPPLMTLQADTLAAQRLGEPLGEAAADGSVWVRVDRAETAATPLAAIFVLERHRPLAVRPIRESARPGRLLPHTLSLDRDPARALSRLGLLRQLAATVPMYRLGTGDAEVAELADLVESTLAASADEWAEPGQMNHASAA